MTAGLSDPTASRVLLVGTARYYDKAMPDLPAVERNLQALHTAFTGSAWGLPPLRCTVLLDQDDPGVVLDTLAEAAAEAADTLVFYFAGHGIADELGSDDQLLLALTGSPPYHRRWRSLAYSEVRRVLLSPDTRARRKVVILDCCFSGLAGALNVMESIGNAADVKGSYVLTATAPTSMAVSPAGEAYTGFTGALLKIMETGIQGAGQVLDMNTVYERLIHELPTRGLPRPQQNNRDLGGKIAFIVNSADTARPRPEQSAKVVEPRIWGSGIPMRNINFTGRDAILEKLKESFATGTRSLHSPPVVLQGMLGVGKTQVAVEYAHRFRGDYDVVWWLPSDMPMLVRSNLARLGEHLGLPSAKSVGIDEAARAALDALRRGDPFRRWLLVFDNPYKPDDIIDALPGGSGHVLITSCNPEFAVAGKVFSLDPFVRAESIEFFARRVPRRLDSAVADDLAEALGDLPLALDQAASFQLATGLSPGEYIELMQREPSRILAEYRPSDYPVPMTAAWSLSTSRLAEDFPEAQELMRCLAFFAPKPILLDFLRRGAHTSGLILRDLLRDPIGRARILGSVSQRGLGRIDAETIQIHRLIQALFRDNLTPEQESEYRREAQLLLAANAPEDITSADEMARFAEIVPHLVPTGLTESHDPTLRHIALLGVRFMLSSKQPKAALELVNLLIDRWQRDSGPDDDDVLAAIGLKDSCLREVA